MDIKKLTVSTFISKSNKSSSVSDPTTFLRSFSDWLNKDEVPGIAAIYASLQAKEIEPRAALVQIQNLCLETDRVIRSVLRVPTTPSSEKDRKTRKPKNYVACIYDAQGNLCEELNAKDEYKYLKAGFDLNQRAREWSERKLFNQGPGSYAEIVHAHSATPIVIHRGDAVAKILKPARPCASKATYPKSSGLSWGTRSKPSRPSFSAG